MKLLNKINKIKLPDFCGQNNEAESSGDEIVDPDAAKQNLSHAGMAAYNELRRHHNTYHQKLWNVTTGRVVTVVDQDEKKGKQQHNHNHNHERNHPKAAKASCCHLTPRDTWNAVQDPSNGHDDWFPSQMASVLAKTEYFADVMSLAPPDGLFLEHIKQALHQVAQKHKDSENSSHTIYIRFLFGNIIGCPVNCTKVLEHLTEWVPSDSNIQIWVGAWRRGVSWNHAKLIAVDGVYLHTGGHNMWTDHYLKQNPVCDLSLELQGRVALDGHFYANEQWDFIEDKQGTCIGQCLNVMPDTMLMATNSRVTVTEFPLGTASTFPPQFRKTFIPRQFRQERYNADLAEASVVPIITMGRYGTLISKDRPSDDAIDAMLNLAEHIVRLALQDLGPVCVPSTKVPLPGCIWPKRTMETLGRIIWQRGVDVEICLSNPGSIPGGLSALEACYGNGWSCVDVAAEIIKAIRRLFPEAQDSDLRKKVHDNLRVCFVRHARGTTYDDGMTIGMHSKHFIVDDLCYYVGSQNLYICDLAEWGVVIDNEAETKRMLDDFWKPMWTVSYIGQDVDVNDVMDGLDIDRDGEPVSMFPSHEQRKKMNEAARMQAHVAGNNEFVDDDNDEEY